MYISIYIYIVASLGINNSLHLPGHALKELLEMFRGDVTPSLVSVILIFSLQNYTLSLFDHNFQTTFRVHSVDDETQLDTAGPS